MKRFIIKVFSMYKKFGPSGSGIHYIEVIDCSRGLIHARHKYIYMSELKMANILGVCKYWPRYYNIVSE